MLLFFHFVKKLIPFFHETKSSKMLFTRHFYYLDEVKAALQYEIHRKRLTESFFWLTELIDSEEYQEIQNVLLKSWFYDVGLENLDILYHILITPSHDKTALYQIVKTLKSSKNDCTLPIMLLYGVSSPTYKNKNIVFKLPDVLVQEDNNIDTFIRACFLGKYLEAWLLSIGLWNHPNLQLYIERIIKYKFKNNIFLTIINFLKYNNNIWYIRCIIIGICCFTEKLYIKNDTLKDISTDDSVKIKIWNNLFGKRARREFTIPTQCLYGVTFRGTKTYQDNNIKELHDHIYIIMNQKIYEEIEDQYETIEKFIENDDEYESFIDSYFPNDIPDEWSLIDQQKSHGIGVNQKSDKPNIRRYFNRWVDLKYDCKIWDKETIVSNSLQRLENILSSFYIEKELNEKYEEKAKTLKEEFDNWNMNSIKLILSILEEE